MIESPHYTADHEIFRANVRRFIERECLPYREEWQKACAPPHALWEKAGAAGLLCTKGDPQFGGAGGDLYHCMIIIEEQTRACFLRAASDARVDPSKDERLRVYAAQYTIMENANDLARLAIRTCGGQSMLKSLPLERIYRDSRCGSLMLPWTAELCLDRIGREALYETGEVDD